MKICTLNYSSAGKTVLASQLFAPRLPNLKRVSIDTHRVAHQIDNVESISIQSLEIFLFSSTDLLIDISGLDTPEVLKLLNLVDAAKNEIDLFVVPITTKCITDTEGCVGRLIGAGVDPQKILLIVNQMTDRSPGVTAAVKRIGEIGVRAPSVHIPDFDFLPLLSPSDSVSKIAELAMDAAAYFDYRKTLSQDQRPHADREVLLGRACWRAHAIFDAAFRQIDALIQEAALLRVVSNG